LIDARRVVASADELAYIGLRIQVWWLTGYLLTKVSLA